MTIPLILFSIRGRHTRWNCDWSSDVCSSDLDLEVLGAEGLRSQQITIRPLGDKLWELKRLYDGIQYRVFFGIWKGAAWLLHSIEKKSGKTPHDDLELARKRLREVMAR